MARNFFRIFTENNPVMWDSKTFCIPEAKGLSMKQPLDSALKLSLVYIIDSSIIIEGRPKQTSGARPHSTGPWHQPPKETVIKSEQIQDRPWPLSGQPSQVGQQPKLTVCVWRGANNETHH